MATVEMNAASTEGDPTEKMLSPPEEPSPPVLPDISAPMNFCQLTPLQFGISIQSFTPASLPNPKDKSRLAQIKARRRSNVGARGSPETNSLIRFIAQQRMKTPPTTPTNRTTELLRGSPFLPRVPSTLRQKMASFQNLMDVGESEDCDPEPGQDSSEAGGCIKTRDYLSDGNCRDGEKENHPPRMTPSKRRRMALPPSCEQEITESSVPIVNSSLKEQEEDEEAVPQVETEGPRRSSEAVEEAQAMLISPPHHDDFELQACSPTNNHQHGFFAFQTPPDDPPAQPAFSFHIPALPPLLGMKPTGEEDSSGASTVTKRKKAVRFGGALSPEFFDKNLPPSTPLQKGGTPARAPTPGVSLQLRSLLKTPQRSESRTTQAQTDLSSPTEFGASPTLTISLTRRRQSVDEDSEGTDGKIVFPSGEEIDSALTSDTECTWEAQPLNLNLAFYEESLTQILTESDTQPSTTSQTEAVDQPTALPQTQEQLGEVTAPTKSRNRRKKQPGPDPESTNEAPARSSRPKRKKPEESKPVKRSTRSAAKSASGKMKASTATRRWNKAVDRSLYGSRAYASKDPNLSPITETLSFLHQAAAAPHAIFTSATEPDEETILTPDTADDTHDPSEESVSSPYISKVNVTRRGCRRLSGSKGRGKGLKKRTVSVGTDDILLSEETQEQTEEENCEEQTTTNPEASWEHTLSHTVPEQAGNYIEPITQTAADTHCTDTLDELDCSNAPTSDCQPSGDTSNITLSLPLEPAQQKKAKRGRRSSAHRSFVQELGNQPEQSQISHEVEEEEKGQGEPAASQQYTAIRSSSESQEEATLDLAPWQADFNIEDVFKAVPTRGQRSVRRSLRNHSSTEPSSAGLAWLPRTSPDSIKESRRKTRGRRLSAALYVQPSLPEETQDQTTLHETLQ